MWCRPALTSSDASDRLKTITSGRSGGLVRYTFGYDAFGRNTGVTVGNGSTAQTLVTNSFDSRNLLTGVRYGSGSTASYTYDALDRLSQTVYNDVNGSYSYSYTRQGRLCSVEDTVGNFKTVYSYDLAGRLAESTQTRLTSGLDWISSRYEYDEANRLTGYSRTLRILGSTSLSATFGDITKGEDPGKVYALTSNGTRRLEYGYDSLGRLQNTTLHNDYTDFYTLYTYHNTRDGGTTGRVKTIEYRGTNGVRNNDTLTYYYNANGQITSETDSSGKEHSYSYDPLGRLYREDDAKAGTTTAYNYDDRGNIAQKRVYAYTTGILANGTLRDTITYTYGNAVWKDLLTAYDGERITYDAIGNPLSYRNGMTFTWQAGRQMKTATVGNLTYTMQYNQDGIRTGKVQSAGSTTGEETVYYIEDGEILGEYRYNAGVKKLLYQFDANGRRIGFTYNGTQYYYRHNLQGDVIAIVDRNADTVARYTYDAWGKVLSVTNASGAAQTGAVVVNIACGLDTRCYRMDGYAHWYNLDLPESIAVRQKLLPEEGEISQIAMSAMEDWGGEIRESDAPALIIIEGLTMYLSEKEVQRIFAVIAGRFGKATVFVETMNPLVVKRFKEKSIEGSHAKFTWGVKNGEQLAGLLPAFRFVKSHSLTEGMAAFVPIYKLLDKLPAVRNISNKIIVLEKR